MNTKEDAGWNPYAAGALAGIVGVLSVLIAGKFFGASTTFARSAGLIEQLFVPEHVAGLAYFKKYVPAIDWQWMFVCGIFFGSLLGALSSGSFRLQAVPDMWAQRFGERPLLRAAVAFAGGFVSLFGARLAGGCPSGHGLSGLMQLSISGFIALACFFAGGLVTARLQYGGRKR